MNNTMDNIFSHCRMCVSMMGKMNVKIKYCSHMTYVYVWKFVTCVGVYLFSNYKLVFCCFVFFLFLKLGEQK